MSYFTQRHGIRKPIEKTSEITIEMYALLFDCCEKYYQNIAWMFPDECTDGIGCVGLDYNKLNNMLKYEIPTLYRYSEQITKPEKYHYEEEEYDQYALLDFIEFIAQNCKDVSQGSYHSFFGHYHLNLLETKNIFHDFCDEINNIFKKTGLLYTLTETKIIERVVEDSPLSKEIEGEVAQVSELGLKDLLEEAIELFKTPHPTARKDAVEKIWDALERLKTYYTAMDKRNSINKIVNDISGGQAEFSTLFDKEFKELTAIGNNFRIRHHETTQVDIKDNRYYDYFFNRCLSLISLALKYLQ